MMMIIIITYTDKMEWDVKLIILSDIGIDYTSEGNNVKVRRAYRQSLMQLKMTLFSVSIIMEKKEFLLSEKLGLLQFFALKPWRV
jgi:hypothetical protein